MAENKTLPIGASVADFLDAIADSQRRADAWALHAMMTRATGEEPVLWDTGIVGFGTYSYQTSSGHKGRWMRTGFALRARDFTIHIMQGFGPHREALARLGPHRHGVSCLYVKRLADVDMAALEAMIASSYAYMRDTYPDG